MKSSLLLLNLAAMAGIGLAAETESWQDARPTEESTSTLAKAIQAARDRGESGPQIAGALNDLGSMYHDLDRLPDAARCYTEAIGILEIRGDSNSKLTVALSNLAGLRLAQARYSDAERLYRRAERVADSGLEVAAAYVGLADTFLNTRRYREALEFGSRAMAILEISGQDERLAVALFVLAKAAWLQGTQGEAEMFLRRAVASWRAAVGAGHPSYASALACLAAILSAKQPAEADRLFQEALPVLQARLGADHTSYGLALLQYSQHMRSRGRKSEAKDLRHRADSILTGQHRLNQLGFTVDVGTLKAARGARR
jgi:tetratricopeptide (TPR) repeat protein